MNHKAVDNSSQELTRIYKENYKNIYYLVLSFVKNRENALDLTQDIFMKAFLQIHSFKGDSTVSTWLYAIAKNHCLEFIRKNSRICHELVGLANQVADAEYDPGEELIQEVRRNWIEKSLDGIDNPERNILYLKYKMRLSVREIQDRLDLSESAVKMRLQRARKRIADSYKMSCTAA